MPKGGRAGAEGGGDRDVMWRLGIRSALRAVQVHNNILCCLDSFQ